MSGTISSFTPSQPEPTQPVVLTVAAGGGAIISSVTINVQLPGMESPEVAYTGGAFTGDYSGISATWGSSGSRGFSLLRQHGWTSPPHISVEVTYNDGLVLRSSNDGSSSSIPGGGGGGGSDLPDQDGAPDPSVLVLSGGGLAWVSPEDLGGSGDDFPPFWDAGPTYAQGSLVQWGPDPDNVNIYMQQGSPGGSQNQNPGSGAPWVEFSIDGIPPDWNDATDYAQWALVLHQGHVFVNVSGGTVQDGGDPPGGGNLDWFDAGSPEDGDSGGGQQQARSAILIRVFPGEVHEYNPGENLLTSYGPTNGFASLTPLVWRIPQKVGNVTPKILFEFVQIQNFGSSNPSDYTYITRPGSALSVTTETMQDILLTSAFDGVDGWICTKVFYGADSTAMGVESQTLGSFYVRGYQV